MTVYFVIRYGGFLTQFAFEIQYELAKLVDFLSIDGNYAIVNNKNFDEVSPTQCSCMFFVSMDLPCRHILKLLIDNEMEPFVPELCGNKWTMRYYLNSHPALASHIFQSIVQNRCTFKSAIDAKSINSKKVIQSPKKYEIFLQTYRRASEPTT